MLSKILSITGRPGLYKLISTNKSMNIVESLSNDKRIPIYLHEKLIALSDVSIYTNDGDTPLREVLKKIREKEDGKQASISTKASGNELFSYIEEILPNYSRESVYASDIKKLISWYNLLIEHNIDFETDQSEDESNRESIKEEAEKEDQNNLEEEEIEEAKDEEAK